MWSCVLPPVGSNSPFSVLPILTELEQCRTMSVLSGDLLSSLAGHYCTILYYIVLYCVVLCCIVLCCVVLCCVVLCCVVLHCVVLYCIVLVIMYPGHALLFKGNSHQSVANRRELLLKSFFGVSLAYIRSPEGSQEAG